MATITEQMKRKQGQRGVFAESVYGRISMVLLFTLTFSAGLVLIFLVNQVWLAITLKVTVVAAGALVAGFTTRRLLKGQGIWLRLSVALFTHVFNLSVLYWISSGYIGFNLIELHPSRPDWDAQLQILGGLLVIWLAQAAWPPKAKVTPLKPAAAARPAAREVKKSWIPAFFTAAYWRQQWERRPKLKSPSLKSPSVSGVLDAPRRWWGQIFPGPKVKVIRPRAKKEKLLFRRALKRAKSENVHLSDDVEYSCPYCLEPVLPNDPRGVVTCKVCGTPHHADCWEITGVCQIPHQHG
jgi:hypothetical protein